MRDCHRVNIGDADFSRRGQFHLLFSAGRPRGERPGGEVEERRKRERERGKRGEGPDIFEEFDAELITQCLAAYFPAAEREVLGRSRRQSVWKTALSKRDGIISWNDPTSLRLSVSMQGSGNRPISMLSAQTSIYGGISPKIPAGDSIPYPEDRAGSSRPSMVSGPGDTDEMVGVSGGPSPKVSISLEDGREFDRDTPEGSDTILAHFRTSDVSSLLPAVRFPLGSLSESVGDGRGAVDGSGAMTFSAASDRLGGGDLSDAVSLATVGEITAEAEKDQRGSDEGEDQDETEEVYGDGGEVEVEEPTTSNTGSSFRSHLSLGV